MPSRRTVLAAATAAVAFGLAAPGLAQTYPEHPIKLIMPFTPGSPNGVLARLIVPELSQHLGQSVVLESRPGGGTSIGTKAVIGASPDGYTLLFSNSPTLIIVPVASKVINYDPLKDFTPVAAIASSANLMVIAPSLPAKTLKDFVAYAKAHPGKLNFGFGQGTQPQLVGEMFKLATKTNIVDVPYRGGHQAVTDMLGGRIQMNIGTVATLRPLHLAGKVRAVAVTSTERNPLLPDIPTMAEAGYPAVTSVTHYGIFAPAGAPAAIVDKLNAAVNASLQSPKLKAALAKLGFTPSPQSPQDFAKLLAADSKKWTAVVKATGFTM